MLYYNNFDPLLNYTTEEDRALNEYTRLEYKYARKDKGNKLVGFQPIVYHFLLKKNKR